MHRFIDEAELLRRVPDADLRARLERWLRKQPTAPILVGVSRAAQMMEVPKPHIYRFREQGRMPEPIEVEGPSAPVWIKAEVAAFAEDLKRERAARAERRAAAEVKT